MNSTIVAAIITTIGTIAAAFIARKKNLGKENEDNQAISDPDIPDRDKPDTHADKEFVIGILLVLICSVLFGISHVFGRYLIKSHLNPLVIVTVRNIVSGILIFFLSLILRKFSTSSNYSVSFTKDSFFMMLGRTVSGLFYFISFMYLSATLSITLYKLNPIYTFIILLFLIKTRLSNYSFVKILIGVIIAVIGSILLIVKFGTESTPMEYILPGIISIILAGIFWSVFIVFSEKHKSSHIKKTELWERQRYVSYIYLLSSIPFIILVLLGSEMYPSLIDLSKISYSDITETAFLGIISGLVGILYFEALKRISSLLVNVIISLEIFFTMIFEWLYLGQDMTWNIYFGAILVIIGAISVGRESDNLKLTKEWG
ncbi:MAG: DMT family transporter [Desulfobacterales bacterium]|nr:DMT family transporter [Desulfobacterales bacterium]